MAKRMATTELNHDNWDDKEVPEERGTFKQASPDVIEKRVIKAAKRRSIGVSESSDVKRSPFAGIGNFKMASSSSSSSSSPFSFLNHVKETNVPFPAMKNGEGISTESAVKKATVENISKSVTESICDKAKDTGSKNEEKSGDYYSKLKGLNESVSDWIRLHVNKNPFCILTPIFKDYEKYLAEIENAKCSIPEAPSKESNTTVPAKPVSVGNNSSTIFSTAVEKESSKTSSIATSSKVTDKVPMFTFGNFESQNKDGPSKFTSIFAKAQAQTRSVAEESAQKLTETAKEGNSLINPFSSPLDSKPSFFGASTSSPASVGFSFGSSVTTAATSSNDGTKPDDEDYQPPKPSFTPVQEEGAAYSKRCKVFVRKDSSYQERGVGTLFLKPLEEKTQLIVRADTSLGNVLMNCLLNPTMSPQKMGDNNIILVCLPTPESKPPPIPVLLKVKTKEDADELLAKLKEFINKKK